MLLFRSVRELASLHARDVFPCCSAATRSLKAFAPPLDSDQQIKNDLKSRQAWTTLIEQGYDVNPCQSKNHPASRAGYVEVKGPERSLQEAYTPDSMCFGCGPKCGDHGMHLRSFRAKKGLVAEMEIPEKFICFPGVVNGGAISTLLDCHGNWAAAIELMDDSCLPRPPLTATYSLLLTYRDTTPPDTPLVLRAKPTNVQRNERTGKVSVDVEVGLYEKVEGFERPLVTGHGVFKRMGALRAF